MFKRRFIIVLLISLIDTARVNFLKMFMKVKKFLKFLPELIT